MSAAKPHHCISQPNIRIQNRQTKNRKRERDPARIAAVKEWCVGKLCTCGCGQPANCAHHPSDDLYEDEWADLSQCEPWQSLCHHKHHKGFVRCPECGGWMKPGREKCSKCEGWVAKRIRQGKSRHPCDHNRGSQRCWRNGQLLVCPYSPRTAEARCDPEHFQKRGVQNP